MWLTDIANTLLFKYNFGQVFKLITNQNKVKGKWKLTLKFMFPDPWVNYAFRPTATSWYIHLNFFFSVITNFIAHYLLIIKNYSFSSKKTPLLDLIIYGDTSCRWILCVGQVWLASHFSLKALQWSELNENMV